MWHSLWLWTLVYICFLEGVLQPFIPPSVQQPNRVQEPGDGSRSLMLGLQEFFILVGADAMSRVCWQFHNLFCKVFPLSSVVMAMTLSPASAWDNSLSMSNFQSQRKAYRMANSSRQFHHATASDGKPSDCKCRARPVTIANHNQVTFGQPYWDNKQLSFWLEPVQVPRQLGYPCQGW